MPGNPRQCREHFVVRRKVLGQPAICHRGRLTPKDVRGRDVMWQDEMVDRPKAVDAGFLSCLGKVVDERW